MSKHYLTLWVLAVVATGAAHVFYLGLRQQSVELGYAVAKANNTHRELREQKGLLSLEAQTLRERQRVRVIAERSLGMTTPDSAHTVIVRAHKGQAGAGGSR